MTYPNNRILQVRMTKNQYDRVKLLSEEKGYSTLSAFVRDILLGDNLSTRRLLKDIWNKLGEGTHIMYLYANDTAGNLNYSITIEFTKIAPPATNDDDGLDDFLIEPVTIIIIVLILIAVLITALVLYGRQKKKES